jgi:hypothetical protein
MARLWPQTIGVHQFCDSVIAGDFVDAGSFGSETGASAAFIRLVQRWFILGGYLAGASGNDQH